MEAPSTHSKPKPATDGPIFPDARPFPTEVEAAELDERSRPTASWAANTTHLSRAHVALISRRLVYPGKVLVVAIHLLDSTPTLLAGTVKSCDYIGEGEHRVVLSLITPPKSEELSRWVMGRMPRRPGE